MPGIAKTSQFLLSTATVMLGPTTDLLNLNPAAHSIGLVKNFQMSLDPAYTELTQGITNTVVMSVRTSEPIRASMEVYEYTLRNIAYASGLDASGAGYAPLTGLYLSTASITAAATAIVVPTDVTSTFTVGTYMFIQADADVNSDVVHIAKVTAVSYSSPNTTITFAGYPIPTGVTYPIGSRVGILKKVPLGQGILFQPDLSAKIVGVLPKNNEPFTILMPRVKLTKGLNVNFDSGNFTNMPFEITPYSQVSTDPFYAEFGPAAAILFPR